MNRPTDKQIEEVLAGIASPEDAKYVAEWFATEEGSDYLEAAMTQDSELIKNEFADLYVDHDIPSKKNIRTDTEEHSHQEIGAYLFPSCSRIDTCCLNCRTLYATELKSRPVRYFRI